MWAERARGWIQFAALLVQNANFRGFFTGKIYRGNLKKICVPGINCYSCPAAVGSCPVGSLQNFLASRPVKFPYYVLGLLLFFGALLGRAVCGFLCPFGFLQELLHRIPFPKKKIRTFRGDRLMRNLKYVILAVFVVLLPMLLPNTPAFCKYLCPAGTLEGGVPIVLFRAGNINLPVGPLFFWKLGLSLVILALCLLLYRPFCKYLCPLGAFYGLMNPVSLVTLKRDEASCTGCGACVRTCPMQADPLHRPDSAECIRCGICTKTCPEKAIKLGLRTASVTHPFPETIKRA